MKHVLFVVFALCIGNIANAQSIEDLLNKAMDPNATSEDLEKVLLDAADAKTKEAGTQGYQKVEDNGYAHDLHKQNVGKIVFSDKEISKATTSSTGFKSNFSSLSGGVYGQVYLDKSLRNQRAEVGASSYGRGYEVAYYADGKLIYTVSNNGQNTEEDEQWTTWQVVPAPATAHAYGSENTHGFAEGLKNVSAGKHHFKVVLSVVYGNPRDINSSLTKELASGEFDLTFTEAEKKAFIDKHEYKYAEPGTYTTSSSGSGSNSSSGCSTGFAPTVRIVLQNKSGANINKLEIETHGSTRTVTSLSNGGTMSEGNARVGGKIYVNGSPYYTVSQSDKDKTIVIQ